MRKEREITIKVIENNRINISMIVQFFANKYMNDTKDSLKEKS